MRGKEIRGFIITFLLIAYYQKIPKIKYFQLINKIFREKSPPVKFPTKINHFQLENYFDSTALLSNEIKIIFATTVSKL